ncbi:MAG: ABC transporter permease, partial [Spirochaetaceae bacterium]|nr:ABC transporter permease [Spirochaetaceae bacterium]
MAAQGHGFKPYRISALFHARRALRKGTRAAAKLLPKKAQSSGVVFWLAIAFLYLPLLVLVIFSFNKSRSSEWTGLSLVWYEKLFVGSPDLWHAFSNSLIIALSSALAATVLGTLAAVGTTRFNFKGKNYVQTISFMPMILPEIVVGVSLLIFFAGVHLQLGMLTVWIAHTTFNLPYVYLLVQSRLEESDPSVIEAAKDLGASEMQTLFRVILPMALPGIASAFLTAVTLSLEDFVITFFVSGPGA